MQNKLKSLFVMLFINAAILLMIYTLVLFYINGFQFDQLGQLIISFTIAFLFIKAMTLHNTARTSANLWFRTSVILVGFLINLYGIKIAQLNVMKVVPSALLFVGWLLYVFWYSRFGKRESLILKVGAKLPNFDLEDRFHNPINTSSFLGKPNIFMFYRGNWCPLCMAQIKEIAGQYQELEKRGVNMNLISPQPHHFTVGLAKKFDVNFNFLVDVDNNAAKKLGIFHKNGLPAGMQALGYDRDTVMPTIVITDKKGTILFADLTDNYRVRPEPETFFKVLDLELKMT